MSNVVNLCLNAESGSQPAPGKKTKAKTMRLIKEDDSVTSADFDALIANRFAHGDIHTFCVLGIHKILMNALDTRLVPTAFQSSAVKVWTLRVR